MVIPASRRDKRNREQMQQLLKAGVANGWTRAQISDFVCHAFDLTPRTVKEKLTWTDWAVVEALVSHPDNANGRVIVGCGGLPLKAKFRWPAARKQSTMTSKGADMPNFGKVVPLTSEEKSKQISDLLGHVEKQDGRDAKAIWCFCGCPIHFTSASTIEHGDAGKHYELHIPARCEGGHLLTIVLIWNKGATLLQLRQGVTDAESWRQVISLP